MARSVFIRMFIRARRVRRRRGTNPATMTALVSAMLRGDAGFTDRRYTVDWEPTGLHQRRLWRPPWRQMRATSILAGYYEPYLVWSNKRRKWGALYNLRSGGRFHSGTASRIRDEGYGTPVG